MRAKIKNGLIKLLRITFYALVKPIVWVYVVVFQHVRFRRNGFKIPKGPVLILSNHVTNWDALYLNCMFFTRIIRFIAHDELFQNKFFAWFSENVLGEVKRGMSASDVSDILAMRRIVKEGATLGLYPEGDIGFFGRTLPIAPSVAKFAKVLGVPVVLTKIQGACIRAPRWADRPRHAHITYSITDVIMAEEVKATPLTALYDRILNGIENDDVVYQKALMCKQFPAPKRAEWLELGLFYCPNCERFETLSSKGDKVFCTACGFKAKYNRYSFLEPVNSSLDFQSLTEWDDAQREALYRRLDAYDGGEPFLTAENLDYYAVKQVEFFKKPISKATFKVYKDRIVFFVEAEGEERTLYIEKMKKIVLQYKDVLEIHYGDERIRFRTKERKWSGYFYTLTLQYLKK